MIKVMLNNGKSENFTTGVSTEVKEGKFIVLGAKGADGAAEEVKSYDQKDVHFALSEPSPK